MITNDNQCDIHNDNCVCNSIIRITSEYRNISNCGGRANIILLHWVYITLAVAAHILDDMTK